MRRTRLSSAPNRALKTQSILGSMGWRMTKSLAQAVGIPWFGDSEGHDGPVYVVEFQGQRSDKAWYNLLTKLGLYGEEHPQRDVIGVGIFLRELDIPGFSSDFAA